MTESENPHLSFDNLPRSVAELHEKIDRLTGMFEQIVSSTAATPSPEIMTVGDVSAMLCKSVSTIYAMTSEHRIPYRKQGNKLYFLRSEIQSWLMLWILLFRKIHPSADGSRRMMKFLRIMSGNRRASRTKIQVKTAQFPHKIPRKMLMGITAKSPLRSVRTNRIPSKAGHIQEAERPSLPCFSQRKLKLSESGNLCRRHGISTAIGAISARAAISSTRSRKLCKSDKRERRNKPNIAPTISIGK